MISLLGVLIVFWLHTLAHFLVIICAFLLAKIDMQAANFSDRQIFRTICFTSMFGLLIGRAMEYLISILF